MRLKARGVACSAPQLWRALVVVLVLVISVLQVVHITLLSRLEARRSRDDRRTARSSPMTQWGVDRYGPAEISEDRARMLRLLDESAVLDVSGEFSLVSNFQPASPPPMSAPTSSGSSSSSSSSSSSLSSSSSSSSLLSGLSSASSVALGHTRSSRTSAGLKQQQQQQELHGGRHPQDSSQVTTQRAAAAAAAAAQGGAISTAPNDRSRGGLGNYLTPDVTLVTQSSAGPLIYLDSLASQWSGPISMALFAAKRRELPNLIEAILQLRSCYPAIRHNVTFHLVYPLHSKTSSSIGVLQQQQQQQYHRNYQHGGQGSITDCSTLTQRLHKLLQPNGSVNYDHTVAYPVNLLRNVARRNARSQYVFVVDADLQVSQGLHNAFVAFATENSLYTRADSNREAFVVPAFETAEDVPVPRVKAELLELLERGSARPFYAELCHKCHKHTDYDAWTKAPLTPDNKLEILYQVSWKDPWEPFYIAHNSAPLYDERFRQYGFNRISQACEMHIAGYSFAVLNSAFVVHRGLKRADNFHKEKDKDLERNRLNFRQFKTELKEKYRQSPRRCY